MLLCGSLFVMGLGMGGTMMPIMTSALKTLTSHEVARGSTLVNILQQIGGSDRRRDHVGDPDQPSSTARGPIPGLTDPRPASRSPRPALAIADQQQPELASSSRWTRRSSSAACDFVADSFATTFWVGFALVLLTFIPIAFLPRRREPSHLLDGQQEGQPKAPVIIH